MSQIEHRGSNRLGHLIGEPDGALIDQASPGRGKGFVSLRMMEGDANAARISRSALATDDQHPAATVRDPPVGADIEQALEHEPGRDEQGASLGENLGHPLNGNTGSPFSRLHGRDVTAAQSMVLRHRVAGRSRAGIASRSFAPAAIPGSSRPRGLAGDRLAIRRKPDSGHRASRPMTSC